VIGGAGIAARPRSRSLRDVTELSIPGTRSTAVRGQINGFTCGADFAGGVARSSGVLHRGRGTTLPGGLFVRFALLGQYDPKNQRFLRAKNAPGETSRQTAEESRSNGSPSPRRYPGEMKNLHPLCDARRGGGRGLTPPPGDHRQAGWRMVLAR